MKPDVSGTEVLAADVASQLEPLGEPAGTLLGWYTTEQGRRRHVRAVATAAHGLCVIDDAESGALLVEPRLDGMMEARALAADYLSLASERGEPQVRHHWPAESSSPERGES